MRCPACQAENLLDSRFCTECGAKLETACAACGAGNAPGGKFCRKCGERLRDTGAPRPTHDPSSYTPTHLAEKILTSRAALEGERKQVTVLFADIKGSMELLEDLDPEEARRIVDPALQLMIAYSGDFGHPFRRKPDTRSGMSDTSERSDAGCGLFG
jgi:ribosomal protein L40E